MKKSMSLIVSLSATGMLLINSTINIPIIHATTIENKESNNTEVVDDWMPDENLQIAISAAIGVKDPKQLTKERLAAFGGDIFTEQDGIKDLTGLEYATNASGLFLSSLELNDLSPLKDLHNLKELNLVGSPDDISNLNDLSAIENLKGLETLRILYTDVRDLEPVTKIPNLKEFIIGFSDISDFSQISKMDNLESLAITGTKLNDLTSIGQMNNLSRLYIYGNEILNFDPLDNLTNLDQHFPILHASDSMGQEVNLETRNLNGKDSFTIDLHDYLGSSPNMEYFQTVEASSTSDTAEVSINDDDWTFDVSNIEEDGVVNLKIVVKTNFNDNEDAFYLIIHAPYILKENSNSGGNNTGNNNNITDIDTKLLSTKKNDAISIYDINGNIVTEKTLNGVTDYSTSKKNVVNGITYYQIGNSEWVNEADVIEYFEYSGTVQTNSDSIKKLVHLNGNESNRGLSHTTDWMSDRFAYLNDDKHYRVSTNEWVAADQTLEVTPINGVLKINSEAKLYHDNGKQSDRGLAENSDFVTDKVATINGEKMYRVSTNEWVPASQVTLK